MSKVEMNAYEAVLRMCAGAAPNAWHPQQYSRRSGTPMETVNGVLKELWDLGLLEKAQAHPDHGPGLRLSAKGWEVLNDPKALHRLCSGDSFMPAAGGYTDGPRTDARSRDEQTSHLLESLRASGVSYVSWLLLGANVVVFLIGLYLAYRVGAALDYLGGVKTLIAVAVFLGLFVAFNVRAIARYLDGTVRIFVLLGLMFLAYKTNLFFFPLGGAADPIRHRLGLLSASDWLRGEWWRALTACFVHLGLLHLMANMSMLYNGGWFIERMWGHGRFFAIYVVAGITGSLTGLAFNPNGLAGASGALCGLVAAEAVWVMFNGKYLPPRLRQEWWNNLSLNLMLLVAISFVPGVSFWGHAGGAAAGAAAAVCLHYQRFGAPVWRWAALLALLPIPLGGLYCLDYQRHHDEMWGKVEVLNLKQEYKHDIDEPLTPEMRAAFQDKVRPVLVEQRAERRADVDIQAAQAVLADHRKDLEAWQAQLNHLGPYINDNIKTAREDRQRALDAVTARLDLYERMERCLKEGENFPANEDKALREQIAATPELQTREERRLADVKKHEETDEERRAREKHEGEAEAQRKRQAEVAEEEAKFEKEHLQDISGKLKTAKTLFDSDLTDYLDRPPSEWVAETVKKNTEKIEKSRKQLKTLMELLPTLGPYKSETIRTALERATACAPELATLLEMAQHRFEAGDKWTKDEQTALKKREMKVDDLYKAWRSSLTK